VAYNTGMVNKIEKLLTEFLEHLEIEKGRSQRTLRNYDFYLRRFFDWAKHPAPGAITLEMVRKFRLWMNRNVKGRDGEAPKVTTQNYHLIALRSFLKYLAKRDIKTLAPEKIELAKHPERQVEFLEEEELLRLLDSPLKGGDNLVSLRDSAILEMLFSTGLRVSELARLEIESVNLDRDEFTVLGKGGKNRIVFVSERARDAVKKYLKKRQDMSPHMFVSHDRAKGKRDDLNLTPRSIQRIVDKHTRKAGITKKVSPHTMRHTFATDLLRGGADIRSVQAMLGHASITTTQIYTHVTNKHLREIHKKHHDKKRKK
jgi:site-specific recombinase XerD